jgi:2-polyprenyl-6-methoxyphenol hydroxylase-like FAD-dependent oxidoreductase
MSPSAISIPRVIIVGGGPVGLLTALRLATATPPIPLTILEALPEIETSPRAMAYQPVAVKELDRAGILDEARKIGTKGTRLCWRRPREHDAVIAELERSVTKEHPYENLIIGQHELAYVVLERLSGCKNVTVEWNTKVVGIEQNNSRESKVKVIAETERGGKRAFEAEWVVGADGGKSSVRKICGIEFEGFTWPQQLVSMNVYYPFDKYGWYDANFLVSEFSLFWHRLPILPGIPVNLSSLMVDRTLTPVGIKPTGHSLQKSTNGDSGVCPTVNSRVSKIQSF